MALGGTGVPLGGTGLPLGGMVPGPDKEPLGGRASFPGPWSKRVPFSCRLCLHWKFFGTDNGSLQYNLPTR